MVIVDFNVDMGEFFGLWKIGDDEFLLGIVIFVNVVCGFYVGDVVVMGQICKVVVEYGVCIGVYVFYWDFVGFGCNFIDVDFGWLCDEVIYQLLVLCGIVVVYGVLVCYVKFYGVLYNMIVYYQVQVKVVVEVIDVVNFVMGVDMVILGLLGVFVFDFVEQQGVCILSEVFVDWVYNFDGILVLCCQEGLVLYDLGEVVECVVMLVIQGLVMVIDGIKVLIKVDLVCVYGDILGVVVMVMVVCDCFVFIGIELWVVV